jgi:hypothetical protein
MNVAEYEPHDPDGKISVSVSVSCDHYREKKASHRNRKSKKMNLRLSEDDVYAIDKIAAFYGITKTDFVVSAIRHGYKEMKELEAHLNEQTKEEETK